MSVSDHLLSKNSVIKTHSYSQHCSTKMQKMIVAIYMFKYKCRKYILVLIL